MTVLTINDGSHDHFSSMPTSVKKRVTSTQAIRDHMDFGTEGKLFAIVLEQYTSKGIYRYELSQLKVRSGYGKGSVARIPSQGPTQQDANRFFGKSAVVAADAPASSPTSEIRAEPSDIVRTPKICEVKDADRTQHENDNDAEETSRESTVIRDATPMLPSQSLVTGSDHGSSAMQSATPPIPLEVPGDIKCDNNDDVVANVTSELPLHLFSPLLVKLLSSVGKAIFKYKLNIYI